MPTKVKISVKIGKEITPAQNLGAITRRNGSTAIISSEVNCSVAFLRPISAVRAEPARPAKRSAATTGPNSRIIDNETN